MSKRIRCFFLDPTDRSQVTFRRYRSSAIAGCPGRYGYCNAHVIIGETEHSLNRSIDVTEEAKLDPRWPSKCDFCDYVFQPEDSWQRNEDQLLKRRDTGEIMTISAAPVGAMWNAEWYKNHQGYKKYEDGIILVLRTPGGDWCVDGPSSNGNGWTRTGSVPDVTASPSILAGSYHGWLRAGWLELC